MPSYKRFHRIVHELLSSGEKENDNDESLLALVGEKNESNIIFKFIRNFFRTLIILNVINCLLETERELYEAHTELFNSFHSVSTIIFTIEYILRIWSCTAMMTPRNQFLKKGRIKTMLRPLNILDLMAILPYYYYCYLDTIQNYETTKKRIDLRFLRIARIIHLLLHCNNKFRKAFMALKEVIIIQKQQLQTCILYILFINVLLRSTVLYIFNITNHEQTRSFPTITNNREKNEEPFFGYDDGSNTPKTSFGKLFAIITGLFGICILAFPVGIIAAGFRDYNYTEKTNKKRQQQEEVLQSLKLAAVEDDDEEEVPSLIDDGNLRRRIRTKKEREEHLQRLKMAFTVVEQAIHLAEVKDNLKKMF